MGDFFAWVVTLISASSAIVVAVLQHCNTKEEREYQLRLKQFEFHERRHMEAVEKYVRSANRSIITKTLDEEFVNTAISIYLHVDPSLWHYIRDIDFNLETKHYVAARVFLEDFCQAYHLASPKKLPKESGNAQPEQKRKPTKTTKK